MLSHPANCLADCHLSSKNRIPATDFHWKQNYLIIVSATHVSTGRIQQAILCPGHTDTSLHVGLRWTWWDRSFEEDDVLLPKQSWSHFNFRAIKTRNIEGGFLQIVQGVDTFLWNAVDKEGSRIEPEIIWDPMLDSELQLVDEKVQLVQHVDWHNLFVSVI